MVDMETKGGNTDRKTSQVKGLPKIYSTIKSKDTLDLKEDSSAKQILRSCIFIAKGDGSNEKVSIKKAKSVHFADSLGKPLKSVKTLFDNDDDIDLSFLRFSLKGTTTFPAGIFAPKQMIGSFQSFKGKLLNFKLPLSTDELKSKLQCQSVCLQNIVFRKSCIFGTIVVSNVCFEKQVVVRYTLNDWKSFESLNAKYVPGSSTGNTDTFSFEIIFPNMSSFSITVKLAICYTTQGKPFWDSNNGKNYEISYKQDSEKQTEDGANEDKCFVIPPQNFIGWST